jgi:hypothetical protein
MTRSLGEGVKQWATVSPKQWATVNPKLWATVSPKQWATVSPKLSGLSRDPDYKGTTVGMVI